MYELHPDNDRGDGNWTGAGIFFLAPCEDPCYFRIAVVYVLNGDLYRGLADAYNAFSMCLITAW
jgi:hypothetical protein